MKSLGDTLRTAREEQGISIDQAVREINISRHFLEALENENFDDFPAEAYLLGFLRNYSDFLGLEPDRIIGQFKNYKLSEEPTPIEELVGPPKGSTAKKVIPWILIILATAVLGIFGIPYVISWLGDYWANRQEQTVEAEVPPPREIRPAPPLWEGEIRPSDVLLLENDTDSVRIAIEDNDGKMRFIGGEAGEWSIFLGEEIYIPGADGRPVWRLYLKDLGLPNGGAIVEIQQLAEVFSDEEFETEILSAEPPSGQSDRRREPRIILTADQPDRYTLDIVFRDFCLLRYSVNNQETSETYYADGDNFRLEVSRTVTLWASNAGALYTKIGGYELTLGRRGEVLVGQIRWIINEETGKYDLTLVPLY